MKLPIFMFVENSINKNRVAMVWKGYHNMIHVLLIFITLCTLCITNLHIFGLG